MEIFLKLNTDLQLVVQRYLNKHKKMIKYHAFSHKPEWFIINAVQHSECIRNAPIKAWNYLKHKRFGSKRTYENYEDDDSVSESPFGGAGAFGWGVFKKQKRAQKKWKTVIQTNYRGSESHRLLSSNLSPQQILMEDITNCSVTDKYDELTSIQEYRRNMGIYKNEDDNYCYFNEADITDQMKDKIQSETNKVIDMVKYKMNTMLQNNCRHKYWKILKTLSDTHTDNLFEKLNQL